MNTQDQPESIEAKIALLEHAVREQMSKVADIARTYWREARHLDLWQSKLEALKEEAEQTKP